MHVLWTVVLNCSCQPRRQEAFCEFSMSNVQFLCLIMHGVVPVSMLRPRRHFGNANLRRKALVNSIRNYYLLTAASYCSNQFPLAFTLKWFTVGLLLLLLLRPAPPISSQTLALQLLKFVKTPQVCFSCIHCFTLCLHWINNSVILFSCWMETQRKWVCVCEI